MVCSYQYDYNNAWGVYDGAYGNQTLGELNPFRYRGYYYDEETGYYYLNARYYNPEWGRFLNCDGTLLGNVGLMMHNTFSYASNNPVNFVDPSGCAVYYSPGAITYTEGSVVMWIYNTNKNEYIFNITDYDDPMLFIGKASGSIGKGWSYRIDSRNTSTKTQRHIEIKGPKGKRYYQNQDGSTHDGHNNSGTPPKTIRDKLKEKGVWDWDKNAAKQQQDNNTDKFSTGDFNEAVETVGGVAIAGATAYGVWVAAKWIIATATAPPTGGASLAIAAATP